MSMNINIINHSFSTKNGIKQQICSKTNKFDSIGIKFCKDVDYFSQCKRFGKSVKFVPFSNINYEHTCIEVNMIS